MQLIKTDEQGSPTVSFNDLLCLNEVKSCCSMMISLVFFHHRFLLLLSVVLMEVLPADGQDKRHQIVFRFGGLENTKK